MIDESNYSLATRARRLTALARTRRDGLQESQARGQVQTALNKMDQALISLTDALIVYRRLMEIGAPVSVIGELVDLEQPAKKLQEQAKLGRPTAQFLQVRSRDIEAASAIIAEANSDTWRAWADQVIGGLPLSLLPRIHFSRRDAIKTRVSAMRTLGAKKPNIPDIFQFQQHAVRVSDELGEIGTAGVDSLLERFTAGKILLADLSQDELDMLREDASLFDQLYLCIGL